MTAIKLGKPFNYEGRTYETIEIDEPTVGAVEAFENAKAEGKSDTFATLEMLALDTGWPAAALRKLRTSDMVRISEALAPFVEEKTPPIGESGGPSAQTSPS